MIRRWVGSQSVKARVYFPQRETTIEYDLHSLELVMCVPIIFQTKRLKTTLLGRKKIIPVDRKYLPTGRTEYRRQHILTVLELWTACGAQVKDALHGIHANMSEIGG